MTRRFGRRPGPGALVPGLQRRPRCGSEARAVAPTWRRWPCRSWRRRLVSADALEKAPLDLSVAHLAGEPPRQARDRGARQVLAYRRQNVSATRWNLVVTNRGKLQDGWSAERLDERLPDVSLSPASAATDAASEPAARWPKCRRAARDRTDRLCRGRLDTGTDHVLR